LLSPYPRKDHIEILIGEKLQGRGDGNYQGKNDTVNKYYFVQMKTPAHNFPFMSTYSHLYKQ
jgi:hypothetical protein